MTSAFTRKKLSNANGSARLSRKSSSANGNSASLPLVDESVRNDPSIYPSPEVRARLFPDLADTDAYSRLLNRSWTRFVTGK